jgi:hypothetical protein
MQTYVGTQHIASVIARLKNRLLIVCGESRGCGDGGQMYRPPTNAIVMKRHCATPYVPFAFSASMMARIPIAARRPPRGECPQALSS